jgi:molecular chaperone HtpG
VSLKSDWETVVDNPIVGKDVLELLSSSMYVNSLSIYREYVQNSADAVEEASALGLCNPREKGRVDILVDAEARNVKIRDNGTGIGKTAFVKTLIALGASRKRGSKARGFRGVGRLAGLGYCRELVFRSRAEGEQEVSELVWDCRRLRAALRDSNFAGTVEELIKDVVRVRRFRAAKQPLRFFEVELVGIVRHGDDSLVNTEQIRDYMSQVAPVPFHPDFCFAKRIEDALREKVSLGNVLIYLNNEETPVYRPLHDRFEVRKGQIDRFDDIELFDVKADGNDLLATGWILHHGYRGAIDRKASIKGLRLRSGNIQVGECDVLDELFVEPRFNSWSVGEIHVLDARILPNGRRDNFEQTVHFKDLLNRLSPLAKDLTRRCRVSSLRRNARRQYDIGRIRVLQSLAVARQGVLAPNERKRLEKDTFRELGRMQKATNHSALATNDCNVLKKDLIRLSSRVQKTFAVQTKHHTLSTLKGKERTAYERVFSLIYECSNNTAMAKQLVDRILARL